MVQTPGHIGYGDGKLKMAGAGPIIRFPWGRAMGPSAHLMSRSAHGKGSLLKWHVCWELERSESGRIDMKGYAYLGKVWPKSPGSGWDLALATWLA